MPRNEDALDSLPVAFLRACPNCAEPIRIEASVCRYCSRPIPLGLKILSHRDGNRGLRVGTDNLYVLWDLSTGQRLQVFVLTPERWQQGWQAFTGRWPDGTQIKEKSDSTDSRCDRRCGYLFPYLRGFSSLATSAGTPSRFATTAKRSFS
jgi:hypothetical protein